MNGQEREAQIRERRETGRPEDRVGARIEMRLEMIRHRWLGHNTLEPVGGAERDVRYLLARVERYREALEHTARELEHWLEWKNGKAMTPQRVKGRAALDAAHRALNGE